MRRRTGLACFALIALLCGCGDDPQALLDTAQLEEKQQNPEHARELYERIVRDHPETMAATIASQRLKAIDATP